ncbi:MAG: SRPBCC family protein [Minisyncoccota bacterium]
MQKQDYNVIITANISAKEAFEAICHVSQWWIKDFEGSSEKLNDEFSVRVGDKHFSKQKLVEVVPDRKIVWLVTESKLSWLKEDKTEWTNTKMSFDISTDGNKTQISFTHFGLVPQVACYDNCVKGWNFLIKESLLKLLTTGEGLPV